MSWLDRIEEKIGALRSRPANIRSRELESIALALGRIPGKRGKEPTFIDPRRIWKPLSIPNHPGALSKYTAGNILDALEGDLFSLREAEGKTEKRKEEQPYGYQ